MQSLKKINNISLINLTLGVFYTLNIDKYITISIKNVVLNFS